MHFTLKYNFLDGYPNKSQTSFFSFSYSLFPSSFLGIFVCLIMPTRSAYSMVNSSLSSFLSLSISLSKNVLNGVLDKGLWQS